MKDRQSQDDGGSHDEVPYREIGNGRLCPERDPGEIKQQGRDAGQFESAADGEKDVEKADKHHRHADEHHGNGEVAVIRPIVRCRPVLSVLFVDSHCPHCVRLIGLYVAEAFKLFAECEALSLIGRADSHAIDFVRVGEQPFINQATDDLPIFDEEGHLV